MLALALLLPQSGCGSDASSSAPDARASADAGGLVDAAPVDAGPLVDASELTDDGSVPDSGPLPDAAPPSDLGPGDLAFIGVNSDIPEGFALVPLVDIPSGTVLRFTERAWNETAGAFEIPEGTATLTLSSELVAGTVFEVGVSPPSTLTVTPNVGTIVDNATGNWGIAGNGDNLFVYVGDDASPTFIAGIAFSSINVWTDTGVGLDGQSSMIPGTLSEAADTITTFTDDNLRYTGLRTGQGTMSAYLPLIADETSYETGNAAYTPLRAGDFAP